MKGNDILRWVGPGLILVLLAILAKRRLYNRFPVFFWYCISIVCITVLRFLADGQPLRYFLVFWFTEACYLVIALIAILSVLRPLTDLEYSLHPWSRVLLFPVLFLIIAASLAMALFRPIAKTPTGRVASAVYVFVVLMCLVEFLLFIISFKARRRAIKWTKYEFGILKGFGALTSLNLIAYFPVVLFLFHFNVGPQLQQVFQAFPVGAFIASATAWLLAFWGQEPPHPESSDMGTFISALNVMLEQYKAQAEVLKKLARHLGLRFVIVPP